ncbi:ABC transporter ATP-binding protein [Nibrella saemangeumensis]|uniref:ABC transporter ATP-binding protein n=1 Tax=Nibrella saemangeumensis TaxID=1084526 RepID=A0ABP8MQC4_9BACT
MKKVSLLFRLLRYVSNYKLKLLGLILIALTGVGFEVLKPLPIKVIIDSVLSTKPLPNSVLNLAGNSAWMADKGVLLVCCLAIMAISAAGSALFSFWVTSYMAGFCQRLVNDLSIELYNKLQRLSLTFYHHNKIGDLLQRLSSDVFVIYYLVAQIIVPATSSVISLGAMFYIMASINLELALVALSIVPLLVIALLVFTKPMEKTTERQYQNFGSLSAFVQQSLASMRVIQAFARENLMRRKMETHVLDYNQSFLKATQVSAGYNQLSSLITGLVAVIVVGLGAVQGMNGTISAGDLFVFLGYITALYGPVNSLSIAIGTSVVISSRSKRLFEILDSQEFVTDNPSAIAPSGIFGQVQFENVDFGYGLQNEGKRTLRNINLTVPAGQTVAIVGPTGAGKSSLISLLSRFYDPWKGRITLDGQDLRDLPLPFLRENVALVLQEPFLFPMTIAENIGFGNPDATPDEIRAAAQAAQAHDFIVRLPQGYDTVITETGTSLSGGERQRISLARAFLKQAPILILDEPTSALDALTEAKVFAALNSMTFGKTVFIITHRLSAIKHADLIITLKDGAIVESGTHQNLLATGNTYAQMYNHQQIA